ncbi:MAG: acetyl-CoA carboxylase carboxyltransferase subunit alpha [bacterium]|nr:acetyl-CoA carboxylase carboxyltransferase subunit alpha [bacterium]MDT8366011.1 acetyl-CoA carboxylase carboxyltransferase subunit alpha [bacterium]
MVNNLLEFEKPLAELERRIGELKHMDLDQPGVDLSDDISRLEKKLNKMRRDVYSDLSRWQKTQIARHPQRPYTLDYIESIMEDFVELHGDRTFADDKAIVGGVAWFNGRPVMVIGHQKGRNTKEKVERNFGMPNPEGYRKALRLMKLAERFNIPVITLVDTPGAFPGIGAEERGQAEAIARNLIEMADLTVPIITVVTGEGGSGGALALAVSNWVMMLENSIYSVISPEGCAAILWKNQDYAQDAAEAMKLTAQDSLKNGIIEEIIPEPLGGAHLEPATAAKSMGASIQVQLDRLSAMGPEELVTDRWAKFRKIGVFKDEPGG